MVCYTAELSAGRRSSNVVPLLRTATDACFFFGGLLFLTQPQLNQSEVSYPPCDAESRDIAVRDW